MSKMCSICGEDCGPKSVLCRVCYHKQHYEKNKGRARLRKQAYYKANKAVIDARCNRYVQANKQKVKAKNRAHYRNNREDILKYHKEIRNTPKCKYGQAIKSAKERNLSWNIDFQSYCDIIKNPCHYCQTRLHSYGGSSLDRRDNLVGYELTNVLPCCGPCNNMRNNFLSVEEMEVAMKAVVEYRNGLRKISEKEQH